MKSSKKYVVREVSSGTFHVRKRRSDTWQDAAVFPSVNARKTLVGSSVAVLDPDENSG